MCWLTHERISRLQTSLDFVAPFVQRLESQACWDQSIEEDWRRIGLLQLRVISLISGYGAAAKSFAAAFELYNAWILRLEAVYETLSADESARLFDLLPALREDLENLRDCTGQS